MSMTLAQFAQPFDFDRLQQMVVANGAIGRLLMACLLGGVVGMDREFNRKSAGVRTNLLICMGCAFFTLLSAVLAGDANPDKGRVASNIVQGIGFLGAGLILHNRSRVSGLTSAASVFVVASIGFTLRQPWPLSSSSPRSRPLDSSSGAPASRLIRSFMRCAELIRRRYSTRF